MYYNNVINTFQKPFREKRPRYHQQVFYLRRLANHLFNTGQTLNITENEHYQSRYHCMT